MQNTVFMLSDASYSYRSKVAGLAVYDSFSKETHQFVLKQVINVAKAEASALVMSIKIALEKNYDNVVFFYDHLNLNLTSIEQYFQNNFQSMQFVWVKRDLISIADKVAKQTRLNYEKNEASNCLLVPKSMIYKVENLSDKELYGYMQKYSLKQLCELFSLIANPREKEILEGYIYNTKAKIKKKKKRTFGSKKFVFFKAIFVLLSKQEKKDFFQYLKQYNSSLDQATLGLDKHIPHLIVMIKSALKLRKKELYT
jgi:hypothetical protein